MQVMMRRSVYELVVRHKNGVPFDEFTSWFGLITSVVDLPIADIGNAISMQSWTTSNSSVGHSSPEKAIVHSIAYIDSIAYTEC